MTTMTDQLGQVLAGRYRLEAGLGTGASAHVYLARDLRLGRRVAVKVLHPGLRGDAVFLRRFGAEAQAVASLRHPNILQVLDWGEEPQPFIVLEHLAGGSLRDLLDSGARLSVAQAAEMGAAVARGLAYAHRRGLLHRDVKPANILFDEDGGVRIADFGLARALAEAALTEPAGAVLGTARYASPEQAEGRPLGERSDVYSLALVCYEAVTGRVPFSGETTLATLMARVGAVLPPSPELGPLSPILAQAAISEPLARLDADEMAASLELLERTLPPAEPLPLAPRALVVSDDTLARPVPPSPVTGPGVEAASGRVAEAPRASDVPGTLAKGGPGRVAGPFERRRRSPRVSPARRWRRRLALAAGVAVVAAGAFTAVKVVVLAKQVPSLAGASLSVARVELRAAGLRLAVAGERVSTAVPAGHVIRSRPPAGDRVGGGTTVWVVVSTGGPPVAVPTLAGVPSPAAVAALRRVHLGSRLVGVFSAGVPSGRVVSTSPARGTARYGSTVVVDVSKGPAPVTIPAFAAGTTWTSARSALAGLRLEPVEVLAYSSTVPAGDVMATSPAGGTAGVRVGSTVTVTVSRGPRLVAVPVVAGDAIAQAVAALRAVGLVVTEQIGPPFATRATTTLPAPGADVRPGTAVTLYVA